jgi:hypothetical protein
MDSEKKVPENLDHLVYAVPDLDAGVEAIAGALGVRPSAGGSHPGFGTRNALLGLGPESYLEVVGPDPDQPDPREDGRPRPFGIDELEEPRLVTWAVRPPAIVERVDALRGAGFDLPDPIAMGRSRPDGVMLEWQLTLPMAVGEGIVPFLIDWGTTPNPAREAPGDCRLVELRLAHPEPETIEKALEAVGVELPVSAADRPSLRAFIESPQGRVELA